MPHLYRLSYGEVHQSSPKSSPINLNPTRQRIVEMIIDNPKITQAVMAEELEIITRAVKRSIKELTEKGMIERVGPARGGMWKVNL